MSTNGQRGGEKTGGRVAGSLNILTKDVRSLIDSEMDMSDVIRKLLELVMGVTVQELDSKGNPFIYTCKPDAYAAKILLEYRYGKPAQSLNISTDQKRTPMFMIYEDGILKDGRIKKITDGGNEEDNISAE